MGAFAAPALQISPATLQYGYWQRPGAGDDASRGVIREETAAAGDVR